MTAVNDECGVTYAITESPCQNHLSLLFLVTRGFFLVSRGLFDSGAFSLPDAVEQEPPLAMPRGLRLPVREEDVPGSEER